MARRNLIGKDINPNWSRVMKSHVYKSSYFKDFRNPGCDKDWYLRTILGTQLNYKVYCTTNKYLYDTKASSSLQKSSDRSSNKVKLIGDNDLNTLVDFIKITSNYLKGSLIDKDDLMELIDIYKELLFKHYTKNVFFNYHKDYINYLQTNLIKNI
jgi:hypothetical protein